MNIEQIKQFINVHKELATDNRESMIEIDEFNPVVEQEQAIIDTCDYILLFINNGEG